MPSILVTGASTGIGRACANLFANRGWSVTGTVRETSRAPQGLDTRVMLETLDLAVPGSARSLATRMVGRDAYPDVLLNNAGTVQFGALEEVTAEELERIFQVNVFGQMELIRGFVPAMRERGSGTIVNVTSLGGTMTFPFFGAYNSTKWAFEGLSEGLWHELKPFGIRVKAVEPGFVETAIWDKAFDVAGDPHAVATRPDPYRPFLESMRAFEAGITSRTTPESTAEQIAVAIADESARLRYPVAAYARALTMARRVLGAQPVMRIFHSRWMGPSSG